MLEEKNKKHKVKKKKKKKKQLKEIKSTMKPKEIHIMFVLSLCSLLLILSFCEVLSNTWRACLFAKMTKEQCRF